MRGRGRAGGSWRIFRLAGGRPAGPLEEEAAIDEVGHREGARTVSWSVGIYAVLGAVLVLTVVASLRYEEHAVVQRFAPNLATEIVSIIVTLAFVQRLLERQERARKLRAAVGALRKGRVALFGLVDVWTRVLKGCLDSRRTEYPRSMQQLFASYYTEELACLDPRANRAGGESWLSEICDQIAVAQASLRDIILTYGGALDADYLEALDEIVDDPFARLVTELAAAPGLPPEEWRLRMNRSRGHLDAHFIRLVHAVRLHNRLAAETSRFRSRHLAPRSETLTIQLKSDRDLAVETEFPAGWWAMEPTVGALRVPSARPAAQAAGGE